MLNAYSWTSVDTITQENNKAYTNYLIHEVGHLFGLSDYYNTKYNLQKNEYHFQPTGCFDMMDYNIGDHSSFSKYLLNWVSPHVIDKKVNNLTISLKSFESSGECLLIPSSNYQNSPFGEYLLIEYFTPTGLNRFEGTYSFSDRDGNTGVYTYPQHHGLRIYHVNASLGYYSYNENSFIGTEYICDAFDPDALTKIGSRTTIGLDFIYSNTIADKDIGNGKVLYHLLEASGENTFKEGKPASNETLFKLDSDFGINHFKDYTFSNGDLVNFTLKVNRISLDKIDITINRW